MEIVPQNIEDMEVRLARDAAEIEAAQCLRYKVFYEEYSARPTEEIASQKRDFDQFDEVADHLIVIDKSIGNPNERIIGTYRMLRRSSADKIGKFYSSDEYDIAPLLNSDQSLLELGRSCVLEPYRTKSVMQLMWKGIADYMLEHNIEIFFGCASLYGTDIDKLSNQLAYLHHYHLAPEYMRPRALEERYVDMNIHAREDLDTKAILNDLPPLMKGYLRLGASVGEGAVIDHQFNTTDVCIVLAAHQIAPRYRKHFFPVGHPLHSDTVECDEEAHAVDGSSS
jgi:L-ornithine Nalpha-acyltransferase